MSATTGTGKTIATEYGKFAYNIDNVLHNKTITKVSGKTVS